MSEILNKIKNRLPNKPYVLFVGTSHTYGECNGVHIDSYAKHLADLMGLECANFGFSGAQNFELMQIVNELHVIDAFNDNCKMVILEPRLTDNTTQIQYESWTDDCAVIDAFDATGEHNHPIIMKTTISDDWFPDEQWIETGATVNDNLYRSVQQEQLHWDEFKEIINDYFINGDGARRTDRFALKQEFKVAEQNLAIKSKTLATAFQDFMIIDSIKNMIVNKGIEFRWFMLDYRDHQIASIQHIYGECTNLMKYRLFNESGRVALSRAVGATGDLDLGMGDPEELKKYVCSCHHLNESGNIMLAKLLFNEITGA